MEILNDPHDVECIKGDMEFFRILLHSSIWTVRGDELFIVAEMDQGADAMETYMLVLNRV